MKDTLSIQEIVQTLRRRMGLILFLTIGLIVSVALISHYLLKPIYQSSSQFIVIQQQNETVPLGINEIETNLGLIKTYSEIIKSPIILEKVMDEMNLTLSIEELSKQIEIMSEEQSQVVTVSAIADQPETAAQIANLVVEEFRKTITPIMKLENVFVLSKANPALSEKPIKPRPIMNMLIAGVIGLATAVGLVLILEFLNTKVKTVNDVEELGITILGEISMIDKKRRGKSRKSNDPVEKEEKNVDEKKEENGQRQTDDDPKKKQPHF